MDWKTDDIPLDWRQGRIKKSDGGVRIIWIPNDELMKAQTLVLRYLEGLARNDMKLRPTKYAHGCVPNRSTLTCVKMHEPDAGVFMRCDIRKFFDNCPTQPVWDRFVENGVPVRIADRILELCCHNGMFPQGAPTSPWLTNLAMIDVDLKAAAYAENNKLTYSRYVDDLIYGATSETKKNKEGRYPSQLKVFKSTQKILDDLGLELKRVKSHQMFRYGREKRQIVGVTIRQDGNGYNAPRKLRLRGRALVHNLAKAIRHGGMGKEEMWALWQKARGYVAYMDHLRRDNKEGFNTADPFIDEDKWAVCTAYYGVDK